ncbi:hypothetical protein BU23DRAFT_559176 [Bimuria novae-zelandiae CBS 107.79]|uniref:Uncharacterized protein n=1 Tax=Bimuria novae-zelandiae CBS 107.79 TaxID=1447943 RepID=A0A6A5US64_9PLEO|nr:hypothetical protein BU23DRAFT_559176 [Bimuria novae-zelandiae CBS 107.79]
MSSSYFDAQPAKALPHSALLNIPEGSDFGRTGLLSPQVSRILDDLELNEKSSSDDDNASLSGEDSGSDRDTSRGRKSRRNIPEQDNAIRKAEPSPLVPRDKRVQIHNQSSSHRPGLNSQKNPHLARFHSLRSMLFSSHIEEHMQKQHESEAEAQWKTEHDLRKGLNRPKTPPEKQKSSKEGLAQMMKAGLKRMASKQSPPPMAKIPEDNVSTASDEEEEAVYHSDDENINHSDIEDLVRWVSKRDPPSDGEARGPKEDEADQLSKADSGHESLGLSDVEELVRWVSRKDVPESQELENHLKVLAGNEHHGYSDVSTQSDSEAETGQHHHRAFIDEDDISELVRWVSHKDGPKAGPIRNKKDGSGAGTPSGSDAHDPHTDDLVRWVTKTDDTSGESINLSQESLPITADGKNEPNAAPKPGSGLKQEVSHSVPASKPEAMESDVALTHDDVDELVNWVTKKKADTQEEDRGPAPQRLT